VLPNHQCLIFEVVCKASDKRLARSPSQLGRLVPFSAIANSATTSPRFIRSVLD